MRSAMMVTPCSGYRNRPESGDRGNALFRGAGHHSGLWVAVPVRIGSRHTERARTSFPETLLKEISPTES